MAIESKMKRGPIGGRDKQSDQKKKGWAWILILFVIILGAVGWFYSDSGGSTDVGDSDDTTTPISSGEYQAVFLDNGQVYFGKLEQSAGEFYELTDVYYMRTGSAALDEISNLSLTKLGNEAHGPEDKMLINTDHIIFIEDMKSDSKVVEAINAHKRK